MANPLRIRQLIEAFPRPIAMWMSNVLIVVDRNNADRNSLTDLAAAVKETGADVIGMDEENLVIAADMHGPAGEAANTATVDHLQRAIEATPPFRTTSAIFIKNCGSPRRIPMPGLHGAPACSCPSSRKTSLRAFTTTT